MKLGCFCDMDGPRVYLQSTVSQKEKNKYCVFGIQKNGTEEPICRTEIENTDVKNRHVDPGGKWGGMNWESIIDIDIDTYIYIDIQCIRHIH